MTTQVITELENLRRKLLDTGTRNRLIHVNRANQKSNSLNIINEISDSVYSILRHDEKRMRFKAMGKDRLSAEDVVVFAEPDPSATSNSERLTDQWLETPLGPEALVRRLLRLANDARTAEEEQGINILYLALGFLSWKEDGSSEIKREAPLILLPVELKRNPKTSAYELHSRDDDLSTNLSLAEKLREDFGINLPDLEESEEWQPSQYFAQVRDSISAKADWTIDENGMQLGFFSFAKLLMHRDLETDGWPNNSLIEHPLISGLLRDGFPHSEPSAQEIQKLDEIFHPSDIIQIIDADASQTKVIEEVRGTHKPSLVVQGPPGTGKSQTIANLIAAAVHDGKKVLFVAEKATALSVVHQRLVNAGLRDLCIELHSRNVSKKVLAQELGRTLNAAAQVLPYPNEPDELCRKRDQLNKIAYLLHRPIGQAIETPFYTMSELISFIGQGIKPTNLPQEGLEHLDRTGRMAILKSIRSYVSARSIIGNPLDHPFYGITDISLQPPDRERALITLQSLIGEFEKLSAQSAQITAIVEQEKPDTLADTDHLSNLLMLFEVRPSKVSEFLNEIFEYVDDPRLKDGLDIGRDWASAYRLAEVSFNEAAWIADIARIREEIVSKINSFWHRLFGSFFRSSSEFATLLKGQLPSSLPAQLELLDQLIDVKRKRKKLADEEQWLKPIIAKYWREERTPFNDILAVANWTQDIKAVTKSSEPNTILTWLKIFDEPLNCQMN